MQRLRRPVRNQSSRGGVKPRLIVLHTTEGHNRRGTSDLEGLAAWFDDPASQASAHKGIDAEGNVITMVPDSRKAWTQCAFNAVALSVEQVGFSSTSKGEWIARYHRGLRTVARQLAHWSIRHRIPLAHSTVRGVCQHKHLGRAGCGHFDCGPGYPERYVRVWALLWRQRFLWAKGRPRTRRSRAIAAWRKRRLHREQRRYAGRVLGTI